MKVIIQGYPGSFHDEVSHMYFADQQLELVCADSFQILGRRFYTDHTIDHAVMAIENSIAGTLLQNYKIIREQQFFIIGEAYLRIRMNLMALSGSDIAHLTEIHSHPMAIYQCTAFLQMYPHVKLVESIDTALSAKLIAEQQIRQRAAIGSVRAGQLYDLPILARGIEDNKANYTRFFVLSRQAQSYHECDKASVWFRVGNTTGSLLHILSLVANQGVNVSKLQSYPVLGKFSEYSFHMDLEFDHISQYHRLKGLIETATTQYQELGLYKKADISAALAKEDVDVML